MRSWCQDAMHRVVGHVVERVVHPAHVPLQSETEAAGIGRQGDAGPGGGFLGYREGAGMLGVDRFVHAPEEADRVAVVVRAVRVGQPRAAGRE